MNEGFNLNCPVPLGDHATVQMAHGGGGRLMKKLIEEVFLRAFGAEKPAAEAASPQSANSPTPSLRPPASPPHDAAVLPTNAGRLAFTTDSFVVNPLFFPGGDIGELAVYGTVNDLAMAGAKPAWLSTGFIIEEGFSIESLKKIVASMAAAARTAGVRIVTGDTKVVDRGKADGVFINTAGVGFVPDGVDIAPERVQHGDVVLLSGDLGRHGMAVMSVREGLRFESVLESDCAPLAELVEAMIDAGGTQVHCLRDLTRGGLAAALNEIAQDVGVGVELEESAVPVIEPVASACELLGLDPFYVANEGRLVAFVSPSAADRVLAAMQAHPSAIGPASIGIVTAEHRGIVELRGLFGPGRVLDLLSGEQMPRIC
ncbi:MAG: hydrogenase expression/formation protein HypE [Pirellulales bacterium]|nr:hydrogenase expression/formation protein HypE [Pirellulales bacterium]